MVNKSLFYGKRNDKFCFENVACMSGIYKRIEQVLAAVVDFVFRINTRAI